MSFLPEGYEVPTSGGGGNYLNKFEEGATKIRVLSDVVLGWRYFNTDNKPVRLKAEWMDGGALMVPDQPTDAKIQKDGSKDKPRHFWAFTVWNYDEKKIQVAEITQATLQQGIKALAVDPSWGDPKQYDITITRVGTGFNDTEYNVIPNPPTEVTGEAAQAYAEMAPDLKALFKNEDPFAKATQNRPAGEEINIGDLKV